MGITAGTIYSGKGMAGMEVRQPEYWKNEMETYL